MKTGIIMSLVCLTVFGLLVKACGEYAIETPCDKAMDIRMEWCQGSENCIPCKCPVRGEEWVYELNQLGMPDIHNSHCESLPCEGDVLQAAEECIEDKNTCRPCVYGDILLCKDGEAQAGFEGICD
jgi:hypothetical protein